jgi:serine protease Do
MDRLNRSKKQVKKYAYRLPRYLIAVMLIIAMILFSTTSLILAQSPSPGASPTVPTPTVGQPINPDWEPPTPAIRTKAQSTETVVSDVRPGVVAINVGTITPGFFGQPIVLQGAGSGWIIDSSGIIVTNNHVVEGASIITVDLSDGNTFFATAVATDPLSDLAVIKINASDLKSLSVGDSSSMAVGQTAIAMGNSLGLGISSTEGIVSALGVTINPGTVPLYNLIQTDAAINPGNTGGPLLNSDEQVIGINSAKVAQAGVEGMGYAINITTAMPIITHLVQQGKVNRSTIGVVLKTVTLNMVNIFQLPVTQGVMIIGIEDGGPAVQAGLQLGDIIEAINGTTVLTAFEANDIIRNSEAGAQLTINYWRGEVQATATVTTEASPVTNLFPTPTPGTSPTASPTASPTTSP